MTETEFTPGEWKVSLEAINCNTLEIVSEKYIVAELNAGRVRFNNDMLFANANLIAQAPAMYEALDKIRTIFGNTNQFENLYDEINLILKNARGEK